jgi:hypothetical protein
MLIVWTVGSWQIQWSKVIIDLTIRIFFSFVHSSFIVDSCMYSILQLEASEGFTVGLGVWD